MEALILGGTKMYDMCTALKPLMMVIPTEGTTIHCPIHKEGHFIRGPKVRLSC